MMLSQCCFYRSIPVYLLIFMLMTLQGFAKRGGYLNFQFLCYQNPDHLNNQGYECDKVPSRNCDPYFVICISNQPIRSDSQLNCPVYHQETLPFSNEESICNIPSDNRDALKKIPDIELPYPLQETYYVKIIVKDSDQFQGHDTIANFVASFSGAPSPNFNNFVKTQIFMRREENRIRNPRARLMISMGLKCDWNLYGNLCMIFCRALPTDNYVCSDQGTKICKTGWKGQQCVENDVCLNFRCAVGAICINIDDTPKCSCNGMIGPQCYAGYDPCKPNPCLNDGQCRPQFQCKCKFPYHGSRCQLKFDLCQIEPCYNNGTCVMLRNGTRHCECLTSYRGLRCEHLIMLSASTTPSKADMAINANTSALLLRKKGVNLGVLFGCLFGSCLFVMSIVGVFLFLRSRRVRSMITTKEKSTNGTILSMKPLSPCPANEYGVCTDEQIYDMIDERATYVYQVKYNDDYLVPSRPTTPAVSVSNLSMQSEHIPMYEDDYDLRPDRITNDNTKDNEYFPSLPTRTPKKKPFQQFFNFKL